MKQSICRQQEGLPTAVLAAGLWRGGGLGFRDRAHAVSTVDDGWTHLDENSGNGFQALLFLLFFAELDHFRFLIYNYNNALVFLKLSGSIHAFERPSRKYYGCSA